MLSQEDFFDRAFSEFAFPLDPTPDNIALARAFCLDKWRERAAERGSSAVPPDLASSCKFTALFASVVFSADIGGNFHHLFNVLDDGAVLDINAAASDVAGRRGIHKIDRAFTASGELAESLESCVARVEAWIDEFARRHGYIKTPEAAAVTP